MVVFCDVPTAQVSASTYAPGQSVTLHVSGDVELNVPHTVSGFGGGGFGGGGAGHAGPVMLNVAYPVQVVPGAHMALKL
jgi:hypothetical protein